MEFVVSAFSDADVFLLIVDIYEDIILDEKYLEKLKNTKTPVLLLLNKIDMATQEVLDTKMAEWKEKLPNAEIIPISALKKFNLENVMYRITQLLPVGEAFYDKDTLTDKPEKFFVSEIIREKILLQYKKEIPYSVEVVVNSFKDEETILRIQADILVERESQKAIIIGHKGEALKKVGTRARIDAETFLEKNIFRAVCESSKRLEKQRFELKEFWLSELIECFGRVGAKRPRRRAFGTRFLFVFQYK